MYGDYTTLSQLKTELEVTDTNDDARMSRVITAVSRAIDRWCLVPPKYFVANSEIRFLDVLPTLNGPTRWLRDVGIGEGGAFAEYGGPTLTVMGIATGEIPRVAFDKPLLAPPDAVDIDQTLDGTYSGSMTYLTDYDLWPINAQVDFQPFREIRWLPATALVPFTVGQRALRVKGVWGWQQPDTSVQTLQLTGSPTGGTFTVSYGGVTSGAIAYNASGQDVEKALLAMSSLATLTGNYRGTSVVEVSDGQLPNDTLTITFLGLLTGSGIVLGTSSLTGGTSPGVTLGSVTYTGPTYPPEIEQACLLTAAKWLMESRAPGKGMIVATADFATGNGPHPTVMEILIDGGYIDSWIAV